MMVNLFSVFDPSSYFGVSLNWLIVVVILLVFPIKFYFLGSEYLFFVNKFYKGMGGLFKDIGLEKYLGLSFLCVGVFMYLMMSNLLGLFPFIFTFTSHPCIVMGWGMVMWLSFFSMGWLKNFSVSLAHLVPEGSPILLAPLMVLIESISHLIRPFTLSIRLVANMMAGHLIVGLLSSMSLISLCGMMSSLILQSVLMVLELGVAVIQGFVFGILLLLYALDYY